MPVFVDGILSKNPAYQSNLKRCKKTRIGTELVPSPEKWQDFVYFSLLARLGQVNTKRKTPKVANSENPAKKREPTQVKPISFN